MKIIYKSKDAENYFDELMTYNYKMTVKKAMILTNKKFGKNSVTRIPMTPEEWIEHYTFFLEENKKASTPKLIIRDLEKKLEYWRKRCKKG